MKKLVIILLIIIGVFGAIQLVPVKRENPPVVAEPEWDSDKTRAYAKRLCYDCHSNETKWPWYSKVAPVSWLVSNDVRIGRQHLNFSEWHPKMADEIYKEVALKKMPLAIYYPMHPEAALTDAEMKEFLEGLEKSFGIGEYEFYEGNQYSMK